jgi:hypothetical protein
MLFFDDVVDAKFTSKAKRGPRENPRAPPGSKDFKRAGEARPRPAEPRSSATRSGIDPPRRSARRTYIGVGARIQRSFREGEITAFRARRIERAWVMLEARASKALPRATALDGFGRRWTRSTTPRFAA